MRVTDRHTYRANTRGPSGPKKNMAPAPMNSLVVSFKFPLEPCLGNLKLDKHAYLSKKHGLKGKYRKTADVEMSR